MKIFFEEFWKAARDTPRGYFAPLIAAINAIKQEIRRI